jgi:hypothetical protein
MDVPTTVGQLFSFDPGINPGVYNLPVGSWFLGYSTNIDNLWYWNFLYPDDLVIIHVGYQS